MTKRALRGCGVTCVCGMLLLLAARSRAAGYAGTPYGGTPAAVPGTIQAANFDDGGEGVAYHDTTPGNVGGAYRDTDVDIAPSSEGDYTVGWIVAGEWLNFTVNVVSSGNYTAEIRVAAPENGSSLHIGFNRSPGSWTSVSIPATGDWQSWTTVNVPLTLTAGIQQMTLRFDTGGHNVSFVTVADVSTTGTLTPFNGTPAAVPGTIQAAEFDNGGEGVAYHDTTPGNLGGAYRQTDVDIAASTEGGYTVGWIDPGEWLNFTVDVALSGSYTAQIRVASPDDNGSLHIGFNNSPGSWTPVSIPSTGDWQSWMTVNVPLTLTAGVQQMTLRFDTGWYNVSFVNVVPSDSSTGVPTTYAASSDRAVRPKPALPALGAAGYKFADPAFGSPLLRVTDANTMSASAGVSYRSPSAAATRAWNTTSTRFYVAATDGTIIPYAFNASTMTASRIPGAQDGGLILDFDAEPEFSAINPDVAYGRSSEYDHAVVTQYDFATDTYTIVADVENIVPTVNANGRTYLRDVETGVSAGTEYLSFIFGGTSQDLDHYAVWFPVNDPSSRKLVDTLASTIDGVPTNIPLGFYAHAAAIDQSGRYVVIGPTMGDLGAGKAPNYVWDTLTDTFAAMTVHGGGHGALGFGGSVNNPDDSDSTDFMLRSLSAPGTTQLLVQPFPSPPDFSASSHSSWNNAQPGQLVPILAAMYRYGGDASPWREWDEEVIAIRTDGLVETVWRFAHHRSDYNNIGPSDTDSFWYTPRPNISTNGRWAIFTSNWEKTLGDDTLELNKRQDVFLVKLQ